MLRADQMRCEIPKWQNDTHDSIESAKSKSPQEAEIFSSPIRKDFSSAVSNLKETFN